MAFMAHMELTGIKRTTKICVQITLSAQGLEWVLGLGEAKQTENTGQRGTSWIEFLTTMAVQST